MPTIVVERTTLPNEMRDALKRHILRERQKKKEEADANEADKQRRREEKAKALSSSKVKLEDTAKDIFKLERTIADLQQQKAEQYKLLKQALTEEDRRKHSQQTLSKEPSWTSLYPTNLQMAQYAHHPQHYLSTQPSHRLLAYKPPPQSQPQSFIPTTSASNVATKRPRSPSTAHIYPSPSGKSSRMHQRPPSPGSNYPSNSPQVSRNGAPGSAVGYQSSQQPSAFSAYMNYMPSSASYANQMARARGPSQMPNYMNPLSFLPQQMVDPKQQQQANVYSHHPMLMSAKNGSIMNGYPLQPQQ